MKQFNTNDSLKHLNFPDSTQKEKREKLGSFLLAVFGIFGLLAMSNPTFQYSQNESIHKEKVNKFWLTPTALNAEKTAFSATLNDFQPVKKHYLPSIGIATVKQLNY